MWAAPQWLLTADNGRVYSSAGLAESRLTVMAFVASGCPLSDRFRPALEALAATYAGKGVAFYGVASGSAAAPAMPFPVLRDPQSSLARLYGASVTPQAVLLDRTARVLYRGRIDDRAESITVLRARAGREDLREAIEEALAGRAVSVPQTKAPGCAIPIPVAGTKAAAGTVTFSKHVAPVLYRHCAACHSPGRPAPFSLVRYEDAAPRAPAMAGVTAAGIMPPWKPAPGPPHFAGERRLPASDARTLSAWARAGAPEGDPAQTPPPPVFPQGWEMGPPDHTITMPPFEIPRDGPDLYHCFVVPARVGASRWVRAFEFRPGQPRALHHALIFLDRTGAARRRDAETPEPGYPCFGVPGFLPSASLGGWAPGTGAVTYPAGTAVALGAATDIVVQLHYHPDGEPHRDESAVGVYFTPDAPTRRVMDVALGTRAIDIPAGDAAWRLRDHFTLPIDVDATGIIPHAHYICRRMRGWAILPSGRRIDLLTIADWDFNWQQQYRYRDPIRLPAGTRLEMEFVYDNSAANPRNPSRPPRRVVWGPDSTDEMAGLHVQVIPVRNEDAEELGRALWGKLVRERMAVVRP